MTDARVYARSTEVPPSGQDLAASLNPEQAAAATFGEGPLLIVAGAGTGKTRTLVFRVAHLIDRGVAPERILLLTFTRRAAQEMLSRVERLVGSSSRRVHGGTFHATAHRLLRRYGPQAGLAPDFTIMDQGDAEDLMQLSRAQLGLGDAKKRFPKKETLHYVYSRHVNTEIPITEILREEFSRFADFEPDILRVFADYTRRKAERNLVDYDDLLLFWCALMEEQPTDEERQTVDGGQQTVDEGDSESTTAESRVSNAESRVPSAESRVPSAESRLPSAESRIPSAESLARRIRGLYDHVLVDEYQDTNVLQARILRLLCREHANITVVGDDAQSVYSFRGASFRNILEFPEQFPGTTLVALEQNYRSTQPILDVTNALISRATERYTKNLWTHREGGERPWLVTTQDEQQQTRFVVERILELHEEGIPLREMAVLFRAGYMSADLEIELMNRKIPFEKWGGLKFLEAAHVKDVLAFLRVLENPRDEVSWYRLLLLLPGIGDTTARSAIDTMARADWSLDAFRDFAAPSRARPAHGRLVEMLEQLRIRPSEEGEVGADIARVRLLYDDILRERYDRVEPRLADLEQLQVIAGGYPSRGAFLSAIALEPPQATQDLAGGSTDDEQDALILSTAHSAKGKEWDAVFLIWAVDGWFPMSRALNDEEEMEEERRLMYVAMTRARDHLAVTYPLNTYTTRRSADYSIDQMSRFIDRGVRELMDRVVPKFGGETAPPVPNESPAQVDLRALLRKRFGG